jgi:hypothetical protein
VFFFRHSLFDIQYSAVRFLISCSFTRAPPQAASVQSDRKRNFGNVVVSGDPPFRFSEDRSQKTGDRKILNSEPGTFVLYPFSFILFIRTLEP